MSRTVHESELEALCGPSANDRHGVIGATGALALGDQLKLVERAAQRRACDG